MRAFTQKILLILFGIAVCLGVLEAGLRLGGWAVLRKQKANNMERLKQTGVCRILCIGESTTAGQYPRFLEEALARKCAGMAFSVIDEGLGATNSTIILAKLKEHIRTYRPDIIVAMIGINDGSSYCGVFEKRSVFHALKMYKLFRLVMMHLSHGKKRFCRIIPATQEPDPFETLQTGNGKYARQEIDGILTLIRHDMFEPEITEEAEKKLISLLSERPRDRSRIAITLAELYMRQGRLTAMDSMVQRAMHALPGDTRTGRAVAGGLVTIARFNEAEALLNGLMRKDAEVRGEPWPYLYLGIISMKQKRFFQAEGYFRKSISIGEGIPETYRDLAEVLWRQKKYRETEDVLKKAVELFPGNRSIDGLLGAFYLDTGRYDEAEKHLRLFESAEGDVCRLVTYRNYRDIIALARSSGIKMVCMQYPMRRVGPLLRVVENHQPLTDDIVVVDNERPFKEIVRKEGYDALFVDRFAGDFGHCNDRGNRLIAENLASEIAKEIFDNKRQDRHMGD